MPKLDTKTASSLTVVGHYNNFEALEAEFNRFAEYYPNVKMNYTCLDNYNGIIVTALSSSEAPDIFFTYPWMAYRERLRSVYETAENLADPALGIDLGCIRESLCTRTQRQGAHRACLYHHLRHAGERGPFSKRKRSPFPATYDELISACEALKKAGYASPVMAYNRGTFLLLPLYYPYFCARFRATGSALESLNGMKPGAGEYIRSSIALADDFMKPGVHRSGELQQLENDYNAVIMRFFEGDVPMMLCSANTVSGTEKRESQSEAFSAHPFRYSFHPVPSTAEGGYFVNTISMGFAVNKNSKNLEMANEFMRFLVSTEELNRMARAKRMVTPCADMSLDGVYAAFGRWTGRPLHQPVGAGAGGYAGRPGAQGGMAGRKRRPDGGGGGEGLRNAGVAFSFTQTGAAPFRGAVFCMAGNLPALPGRFPARPGRNILRHWRFPSRRSFL